MLYGGIPDGVWGDTWEYANRFDLDRDGDSDLEDFAVAQSCLGTSPLSPPCLLLDRDSDLSLAFDDLAGCSDPLTGPRHGPG